MATLEKIRTRGGVFIAIIIGIALLSFIISPDSLQQASMLFSTKYDAGKIAGKSVSYQSYQEKVDQQMAIYEANVGGKANVTEQVAEEIREKVWQDYINEHIIKGFEKVGLFVSNDELNHLVVGNNPAPLIRRQFTDQQTGIFDRDALIYTIQNLDANPMAKSRWIALEEDVRKEQMFVKYSTMIEKSLMVNSIDLKDAIDKASTSVEFSYIVKPYMVIDTITSINNSELKSYYNEHKKSFKQTRSRDIEYVAVKVESSPDDYLLTMNTIQKIEADFIKTPVDELGAFVSRNSDKPFDNKYYGKGQLPEMLDTFAFSESIGSFFPLYQEEESYNMSRISDIKNLPDSVRARHILLSAENTAKVDSLIDVLKSGKASFADLAAQYGTDGTASNGGDLNWFTFDRMVPPFSDSAFHNPKGKIMRVNTQFGVHIIEVTDRGPEKKHVQIATIQVNVTPGKATEQARFNDVNSIATELKHNKNKTLAEVAAEKGIEVVPATNIGLNDRRFGNFNQGREIIRWAYNAEIGDVSEVYDVDNSYFLVAVLTKIREEGIPSLDEVKSDVERAVKKQKQADLLAKDLSEIMQSSNNSIDEVASKAALTVSNVNSPISFATQFIPGIMLQEPKLLGAVTAASENTLAGPIKGEAGVYVFSITNKTVKPEGETDAEMEKMRLQNSFSMKANQFYTILMEKANITDNRGKFY